VQVFFDDQPAPLLYVQSRQVNMVAPFELTGRTSTAVRLVYNGAAFGPFDEPVLFANPTLFRLQPEVSTQAEAVNQDRTINGPDNSASAGSVVPLYGTGFGLTNPSFTTGALNAPGPVNLASGSRWRSTMPAQRVPRRSTRVARLGCYAASCGST
jgi:uncharacterized protein (TIGR03437 family)